MTAVRDAVEIYVNLNLMLLFALAIWLCLRAVFARTGMRHIYTGQLTVLKILLILVALSPVLAGVVSRLQEWLLPGQSLVLSDMVVAAYLRGDIALGAIEFEQLLNTRRGWMEDILALQSPVFQLLTVVLALGLGVFAVRFVNSIRRMRRIVAGSHVFKRLGRVDLRVSETVRVPLAARGVFRRHIVLPYDLESAGRDRQIALAHELQHFRNWDLEWEIGMELLRPLFFWNPGYLLLKREFDCLRELSCDQAVLQRRGFEPVDYAMCLLRFCERALQGRRRQYGLNVALIPGGRRSARRELTKRVLSLKSMPRVGRLGVPGLSGFLLCLGLSMAMFSASIQTQKDWSQDRLMLSTVVNLERFAAINRGF